VLGINRPTRDRGWLPALSYASGNFGKSAVLATFDTVLFFYLTSICGISLSVAGLIIMTAFIWDGFGDILIGYWADRIENPEFLKFMLIIGAPLCGAAFAGVFYVTSGEAGGQDVLIALLCCVCRIGYTLCDVAHNSMLVNISTDERGASGLSGLRLIFSAAGTTAVGFAFKASLLPQAIADQKSAFLIYAFIGGIAFTLTLLAASTLKYTVPISRKSLRNYSLWRAILSLAYTDCYRKLCLLIMMQAGVTSLFMKSLAFLGLSYFHGAAWAGYAIVVVTASQALTLPVLILLGRWGIASRYIMLGSHALMAISMSVLVVSTFNLPVLSFIALIGVGIANAGTNMTIWAKLALIVREQILVEKGLHAFPVGLFLAVLKCSSGVGSGILAFGLSWGMTIGASQALVVLILAVAAPLTSSLACILIGRHI
jgi:Na+/melibiose symporter-like transporter